MHGANRPRRVGLAFALVALLVAAVGADRPEPGDEQTFRPTVLIRKGRAQGSGTIIASVDNETLVLTAAHVVQGSGPLHVEFHRFNLGLEKAATKGTWPRRIAAEVVARDRAADVAVLRIRKLGALPYVAKFALRDREPDPGTAVTSIGIDLGTRLSSWSTHVTDVERFEIEGGGSDRLFLITGKAPEHGRSGGGLFLENGELVGVCIGRSDAIVKGKVLGVFASGASVRRLLRDHELNESIVQSAGISRREPITTTHAAESPR